MAVVQELVIAFWEIFMEMAPYLMLGFLLAGALHVYFPRHKVSKYLGKGGWKSALNAALVGVPLPLCSCGVIPTGISFHKNGASKGAAVSFLISTPQTGVDSILITYSLMGLPFAIIRPIAAFVTGIVGGALTPDSVQTGKADGVEEKPRVFKNRFLAMLKYAFVDFLQDIAKWLLIGLGIAAAITVLVPDSVFEQYLNNPYLNMLLILLASVPMYVCATGSVPIAVALMMKGISPGAAFVFLMAGPATNAGTITVIGQSLGKKALFTYLATIISGALLFGFIINAFLPVEWFTAYFPGGAHSHFMPHWLEFGSSVVLLALMIYGLASPYFKFSSDQTKNQKSNMKTTYAVNGMTCNHCKASVEKNVGAISGVKSVQVDLASKIVVIEADDVSDDVVANTVNELGFEYSGKV